MDFCEEGKRKRSKYWYLFEERSCQAKRTIRADVRNNICYLLFLHFLKRLLACWLLHEAPTLQKQRVPFMSSKGSPDDERLSASDSDDDGNILFQQSLPQKQSLPLQPPPNFKWDDLAIVTCFQQAIASHDDEKVSIDWAPPSTIALIDMSALDGWEPAELSLPSWFTKRNEPIVAATSHVDPEATS